MGTLCILFGLVIFLVSLGLGCVGANWFVQAPLRYTLTTLPSDAEIYFLFIGVCGFVGLLICLNLVMHGLIYNKLNKLSHRKSH